MCTMGVASASWMRFCAFMERVMSQMLPTMYLFARVGSAQEGLVRGTW